MKAGFFKMMDRFDLANRLTLVVYLGGFMFLLATIGYAGRRVLFMPWTSRSMVSPVIVDHHIYAFGGRGDEGGFYADILDIDLSDQTIKRPASLPEEKIGISPLYQKGEFYLIGGYNRKSYSDQVLKYNLNQEKVDALMKLPFPVSFGGGYTNGKYLYYLGGWDGKRQRSDILRLDPESGDVRTIAHLPSAREFFTLVRLKDSVFLLGGENSQGEVLDEILEISTRDFDVKRIARLPSARMYMGGTSMKGKIYCFGGWSQKGFCSDILELDPSGSQIKVRVIAQLKSRQAHISAVSDSTRIYLVGGTDETNERQIKVQIFNPDDLSLKALSLRSYSWW